MDQPSINIYWWANNNNFGDFLAPLMLEHYTKVVPTWAGPTKVQVLLTGSNLDVMPKTGWDGIVAGAGMLHNYTKIDLSNAIVLGLRGCLTEANVTGIQNDYVLGDPGLLASELVYPERGKYEIGVIPHWTDKELWDKEYANSRRYNYGPLVYINPLDPPLEVIKKIGSCNKIITSSLHAVITADSFSIPRRVERFAAMKTSPYEGDEFKFQDYASALDTEINFGVMEWSPKVMVDTKKVELFNMMMKLKRLLHD